MFNLSIISGTEMNYFIQRIKDFYIQIWYSDVTESSKLETYRLIKNSFEREKSCDSNINHRISLTKFRCSSHKRLIEKGRFRNIKKRK